MGTIDRYRRWFQHEQDSHAKVLASLNAVPDKIRLLPDFQKAIDLMAHIDAARRLWLYRFGVTKEGPRELFPHGVTVPDLVARVDQMQQAWSTYLDRLED